MTMETDLPYLERDEDRHGNPRVYVRRHGKRIRIKAAEGTVAFAMAYSDAMERLGARAPALATAPLTVHPKDTLGWLGSLYFATKNDFLKLAKESQRARRNSLEECFRQPFGELNPEPMGNCPLKHFTAQKAKRILEGKDTAGAATNRRKHLSALCAWGVDAGHLPSNPIRDIKAGRVVKGGGYYTWTIPDVEQFIGFHKIGSKAVLALGLLLFSGARRQDMVDLGRQHARGGWIRYVPKKTLYKRRDVSQKPLLPVLAQIIAHSPCGSLTFLETAQGKPFTPAGFGNWFRERCDEANLPQCTAHGLKKAGATIAAENGATTRQLMAMFDWSTISQAEVYTRAADQKRLAGEAMGFINLDQNANRNVAPVESSLSHQPNSSVKTNG
jgi:integrase